MTDQLPLFEGYRPTQARLAITGGFATVDGARIPTMKLGTRVQFLVTGEVTAVKHKTDKDGAVERQHVVLLDGFTTDEHPIDDEDMKVTISHVNADGERVSVDTTSGALSDLAEEMEHHATRGES